MNFDMTTSALSKMSTTCTCTCNTHTSLSTERVSYKSYTNLFTQLLHMLHHLVHRRELLHLNKFTSPKKFFQIQLRCLLVCCGGCTQTQPGLNPAEYTTPANTTAGRGAEETLLNGWRAMAYSFILRESRARRDPMNSLTRSCSVSAYFVNMFSRTLLYLHQQRDGEREREREGGREEEGGRGREGERERERERDK